MVLKEGPPTILLAHGDVVARHAVAEYLRSCGLRVVEAASSDEAAAVLDRLRVDAVLGDERTPGSRSALELVVLAANGEPRPRLVEVTADVEHAAGRAVQMFGRPASDPAPATP